MRNILFVLLLILSNSLYSQLIINGDSKNSILSFENGKAQGIIPPYTNSSNRNLMLNSTTAPEDGMLIYDNVENKFYYFKQSNNDINPPEEKGNNKGNNWISFVNQNELFNELKIINDSIVLLNSRLNDLTIKYNKYTSPIIWKPFANYNSSGNLNFITNGNLKYGIDCYGNLHIEGDFDFNYVFSSTDYIAVPFYNENLFPFCISCLPFSEYYNLDTLIASFPHNVIIDPSIYNQYGVGTFKNETYDVQNMSMPISICKNGDTNQLVFSNFFLYIYINYGNSKKITINTVFYKREN